MMRVRNRLAMALDSLFAPTKDAIRGEMSAGEWHRCWLWFSGSFAAVFTAVRVMLHSDPAGSWIAPPAGLAAAALAFLGLWLWQVGQGRAGGAGPRDLLLLVEDYEDLAVGLRKLLAMNGWDVDWAPTRTAAFLALARRPRWILLDLNLPDGDGAEVLRAVRGSKLPVRVAVMSGLSRPEAEARVGGLAPDLILPKPISVPDLLGLIGSPEDGEPPRWTPPDEAAQKLRD